ncbi:MAG: class I SAM-dependent methyltransferase [Bacteroidetes bacterium]|nr:class I SAM-dependent methyltransferase [Bacteroidota bacterium]
MENSELSHVTGRSFTTISPSAKALLLLKGYTTIPFAKEAAELISLPEKYEPDFSKREFGFWARVVHFEMRYHSINELLAGLNITNILELSSGFSFRSLQAVNEKQVYYIDTDLPELISTKKEFVTALQAKADAPKGKLEILPLNALNEAQFEEVVNHFPPGEIAIVNEGLLMYLDLEEKKKLCSIIKRTLEKRGGYWITADIYTRIQENISGLQINDKLQRFFEEHKIEENKFQSFEDAGAFFKEQGFVIDKEAEPDYGQLSSINYFLESTTKKQLENLRKGGKGHASWRLKLAR